MLIVLVSLALTLVYWYVRRLYSYWERRGVPTVPAVFPYGNFQTIGKTHCHQELFKEIYDQLKPSGAPFCGAYSLCRPVALLLDVDLIKRVLVTDFDVFHDRGVFHNARDDPLSANLLTIEGKLWRDVRHKLTGIFTTAKMRQMYGLVGGVADMLLQTIEKQRLAAKGGHVEMKDLISDFMTDVIGVCALGMDINSLQDPDPMFRNYGKKTFDKPRNHPLHSMLLSSLPGVGQALRCRTVNEDVEEFYVGMVKRVMRLREDGAVRRNDFMDLMMDLRAESNGQEGDLRLSIEQIASETYAFFLAGLGTTSSMLSFLLFELSLDEALQERMRDEIYTVLDEHKGEGVTFEALADMTYMTQAMNESLRKYPPFGNTIRVAKRDYRVPGTEHIIERGTSVWTPVHGLHHDPEYYPQPERFDPDRFSAEETAKRNPMVFMPFGSGPRKCIGYRFVLMIARLALVKMLTNYRFAVCPDTNIPLHTSKKFVLYEPVDGVTLAVQPQDDGRRKY